MDTRNRVKTGVREGGEFAKHDRTESGVALLDGPGWSADRSLVTIIESPVGPDGNFHVGLRPGALQTFEFGQEIEDPHGYGRTLLLGRDGDIVTAQISIDGIDFTDIEYGISEDLRGKYDAEITEYLLDNYGITSDNATEWDDASVAAKVDVSEYCTSENGEDWITTANAVSVVYSETRLAAFGRDLDDGTMFTKLSAHLQRLG